MMRVSETISTIIIAGIAYIVYSYHTPIFEAIETIGLILYAVILAAPITAILAGVYFAVRYVQKDLMAQKLQVDSHYFEQEMRREEAYTQRLKAEVMAQKKTAITAGHHPQLSTSDTPILTDSNPHKIVYDEAWISDFAQPEYNAHIAVFGATGDGKTTLITRLVWELQRPNPSAAYHIFDHHDEANKWFTPVVSSDLNDAEKFAHLAVDTLAKRRDTKPPFLDIFIANEINAYARTKFAQIIQPVASEGRKYGEVLIFDGQEFNRERCGFSPEMLNNFGKIFMGNSSFLAVNHALFPHRSNRPLKNAILQNLTVLNSKNNGLKLSDPNRTRFGLAVPMVGMPFVFQTPIIDVSALQFNQKADINQIFALPDTPKTDLDLLMANSDRLRYKNGVISQKSVSEILECDNAGAGHHRIKRVIKEYSTTTIE